MGRPPSPGAWADCVECEESVRSGECGGRCGCDGVRVWG